MTNQPTTENITDNIKDLSFEAALAQLESIVGQLESGSVALADSIDMYERGAALKAHCETILKAAQARVEKIHVSADGAVSTSPFDPE